MKFNPFSHSNNVPRKPEDRDEQISMIWEAIYNHIPSRMRVQDIKFNFVLAFLGIVLAFLGILTVVIVRLLG